MWYVVVALMSFGVGLAVGAYVFEQITLYQIWKDS